MHQEKLPVVKVFVTAFTLPWRHRDVFIKALAIPGLAIIALTLGWSFLEHQLSAFVSWLLYLVYGGLFAWFAVACHRLVLLGPGAAELRWSMRHARFFGWLVAVGLIYVIVSLVLLMTIGTLVGTIAGNAVTGPENWFWWASGLLFLPIAYLLARLSLVFPAVAIDVRADLRWAWGRSENNGWRLAVIVGVLPVTLSLVLSLFQRENASGLELVLLALLGAAALIIEIAALSLSYRALNDPGLGNPSNNPT